MKQREGRPELFGDRFSGNERRVANINIRAPRQRRRGSLSFSKTADLARPAPARGAHGVDYIGHTTVTSLLRHTSPIRCVDPPFFPTALLRARKIALSLVNV